MFQPNSWTTYRNVLWLFLNEIFSHFQGDECEYCPIFIFYLCFFTDMRHYFMRKFFTVKYNDSTARFKYCKTATGYDKIPSTVIEECQVALYFVSFANEVTTQGWNIAVDWPIENRKVVLVKTKNRESKENEASGINVYLSKIHIRRFWWLSR